MTNQVPPAYMTTIPAVTLTMTTPRFDNRKRKYLAGMKTTAIMHLVGGPLLVVLGIVAIILLAQWSYYATPIWSGIVIYILTGILGLLASSRGNKCLTVTYIILSVIAVLMSISLIVMYSFAASYEGIFDPRVFDYICRPGSYFIDCAKSMAARQTFDALIVVTALFELIVGILSTCYSSCLVCTCCYSCCGDSCNCCLPPPPPTGAVYTNSGSLVPTASPGLHQGGNIVLQGGMPYPGQPVVYIVQQGPTAVNPDGVPLQYGPGTTTPYTYVNPAQQQPVPNQQVTVPLPAVSAGAPQHAQPNVYAAPPAQTVNAYPVNTYPVNAYPSYSDGHPEVDETKK